MQCCKNPPHPLAQKTGKFCLCSKIATVFMGGLGGYGRLMGGFEIANYLYNSWFCLIYGRVGRVFPYART
jgi:hypothetical protein